MAGRAGGMRGVCDALLKVFKKYGLTDLASSSTIRAAHPPCVEVSYETVPRGGFSLFGYPNQTTIKQNLFDNPL